MKRLKLKSLVYKTLLLIWLMTLLCHSNPVVAQKISTFQSQINKTSLLSNSYEQNSAVAIFQLADKGFFCAGTNPYPVSSKFYNSVCFFRLDSLGRKVWIRQLGNDTVNYSYIWQVRQISPTTFVMLVIINPRFRSGYSALMKVDINGNILWTQSYIDKNPSRSGNGFNSHDVVQTTGGLMLSGINSDDSSLVLAKLDDNGNVQWQKEYSDVDSSKHSRPFYLDPTLTRTSSGGYIFCSYFSDAINSTSVEGFFITKTDGAGNVIWSKTYYPKGLNSLTMNVAEINKDIYITGIYPVNLGIIKLDSSGNYKWAKGYKGLGSFGDNLLYDSSNNQIALPGIDGTGSTAVYPMFVAQADTGGHIKKIRYYQNAKTYGAGTIPTHRLCKLANGFALFGGGPSFYIAKTDTGGNSGQCPPVKFTSSEYPIALTLLPHRDSMTTPHLTNVPIGVTINSFITDDSIICPPFISWFAWKGFCSGYPTHLYDSTYSGATSWHWDFGDPSSGKNDTSTSQNPVHTFANAGTYHVTLVSGNGVYTDSATRDVIIYPSPTQLKEKDITACLDDSVNLVASGALTYQWNKPDMLSDSSSASTWAYPYKDTVVLVKAGNNNGCYVSDTFKIKLVSNSSCPKSNNISGIINQYAAVTAYDSCVTALTVDTGSFFKVGDKALLIQMQGAEIDTSNTASFGTIKTLGNTGNHEYVIVDSIAGQKIFLRSQPLKKYDMTAKVQLVTIPQYANVVISGTLRARAWNGTKGGILIFEATGTIFMTSAIDVSGQGFRGGKTDSLGTDCDKTDYFYPSTSLYSAYKGEGITVPSSSLARGRGSWANGGGGGNSYVSGGGGGAGYGYGGLGGKQSNACTNKLSNGGIGGNNVPIATGFDRLIMGGGGGAGFAQNSTGSPGATGGGIAIVIGTKLVTYGHPILSNGDSAILPVGYSTGGGGGGGGGSIFLDISAYVGKTSVQANGSKGADATSYYYCTGPGGGGGGGAIFVNGPTFPSKMISSVNAGISGINTGYVSPCVNSADGAGPGGNGALFKGNTIPQNTVVKSKPIVHVISASITDIGHVQLQFDTIGDAKIVAYQIYRKLNAGLFKYIATLKHPVNAPVNYIDTVNTIIDTFSYHVLAVDTCGNTYPLAHTHRTMHASAYTLGCEQAIHLVWNNYLGWDSIKKYELYRSINLRCIHKYRVYCEKQIHWK